MSFDEHLNKLKQAGMLPPMFYQANEFYNPLTNPNTYNNQRVSFTKSSQDKGIYGLRGGGLKTNDNNPMLKSSGLDSHLLDKQPMAVKEEIEEMGEKKKEIKTEPSPEMEINLSGKLERLHLGVKAEERKHGMKSSETKSPEMKPSELKPVKSYENDNDLPEHIKKELKDFGKSFESRNIHRKLIEYDKDYNIVTRYKNITEFRNKVEKNFRGSFTYRGQYHNLSSGNKLVAVEPKGLAALLEESTNK